MGLANWKKRFLDMNTGVSKITIAEDVAQNCIQREADTKQPVSLDNRLVRILNVKTLGSEVSEVLKPKLQQFEQMTPMEYQNHLKEVIEMFQLLKKKETRNAIRVLQAETVSAELLGEFRIMLLQG